MKEKGNPVKNERLKKSRKVARLNKHEKAVDVVDEEEDMWD